MCEIDIGNPKYTRNTLRLLSSGTKLFITFELKVFRPEEREAQSFYADFSICPPPPDVRHPAANYWSGIGEPRKSTFFLRGKNSTLWLFPNLKILSPRFRCVTSLTSPGLNFYLGFLFWHFWMTHPLHARVNTCAHVCT